MMWVIIGHEYSLVINSAVSNLPDAKEVEVFGRLRNKFKLVVPVGK
jgi:hypothetical protein